MRTILKSGLLALLACTATLTGEAVADCCGPPPTPPNEIRLGQGWTGSVLFEHMEMTSLLRGSEEVSPDQVLRERLAAGASRFSVPTEMFMDRATLQMNYRFDDHHAVRVSVPWRFNQMDMRMAQKMPKKGGGGMAHHRMLLNQGMSGHDPGMGGGHDPNMGGHDPGMGGGHDPNMGGHDPNMGGHDPGMGGGHDPNMGGHDPNMGGHDPGMGGGHDPNMGGHDPGMGGGHDPNMGGHDPGMGGGHDPNMGGHAQPMVMTMDHTMQPVDGLGDIAINYSYTFPIEDAQVYLGAGLQLPSGQWTVRDNRGQLVHNMMQPGSGAVAMTGEAGADIGFGDSKFSLHPRLGILWNATNPLGYQRGTRFDYELGARYRVVPELSLGLDLMGFTLGKDSTNGTIDPATGQVAFQRPETSLVDNVANTGGSFLFLAPSIRLQPSENLFLGFQYRLPLHQDVNGTQLGIDSWYRGFLSARF
jgi:hypothetical protein